MLFENVFTKFYMDDGHGSGAHSLDAGFELPKPRTRKEYFMAIAAGGVPGEDFPARYDVQPVVEHKSYEYEVTLVDQHAVSDYLYSADISNFTDPLSFTGDMIVKINGKAAQYSELGENWENADGYILFYTGKTDRTWSVEIASETELSGDALNVTVETSWDDDSDPGTPIQPHTIEEAYWATVAQITVSAALPPACD